MPRSAPFDDAEFDALLAGSPAGPDGADPLASFVEDVRSVAGAVPTPSSALAAALATGGISTEDPPVSSWRKTTMKIKGFLAGLGIAGKVALGVGVAAAATTGAGAAGVLPGPVQDAVSSAVETVSPFSLPHSNDTSTEVAGVPTTPTTVAAGSTTDVTDSPDQSGDDSHALVPPTTEAHDTTPTTEASDNSGTDVGSGDGAAVGGSDGSNNDGTSGDSKEGSGDGGTTSVTEPKESTPTTEQHDGDSNNPESITLHCVAVASPVQVSCTWTASTGADHVKYALLRWGDGQSRVVTQTESGLAFLDTNVVDGTEYSFRVVSLRADNTVEAHSAEVSVDCCGGSSGGDGGSSGGDSGTSSSGDSGSSVSGD